MLDTKLKKMRKFRGIVVFLCIFLPAVFLVLAYPAMNQAVTEKAEAYEAQWKEPQEEHSIAGNFINYATEASYYLYGKLLQEATQENVSFDVLTTYGWTNDYYYFMQDHDYYAEYSGEESSATKSNVQDAIADFLNPDKRDEISRAYEENGMVAYLILEYDAFGAVGDVICWNRYGLDTERSAYQEVMDSVNQYQVNARYYEAEHGISSQDENGSYQMEPKNFRCVFILYENSPFFYTVQLNSYVPYEEFYFDIGALWIVIAFVILVAFFALVLPCIKPLETGWERLFCLPWELVGVIFVGAVLGFIGMFFAMSRTNIVCLNHYISQYGQFHFLNTQLNAETCFAILQVFGVVGWSLCFLMEYIVVAAFRQFCCNPKVYLKERTLGVRILRWIFLQCKKMYHYVTAVDITEQLEKSIRKIVFVNFVVLSLLVFFWCVLYGMPSITYAFGVCLLFLYSYAVYVLLRKYGQTIQRQYKNVINAAHQMAQGNLKISLSEDLGVFDTLGVELQKVQEGFSKAVVEEAKSQNMKTELITNISHDLKTPLTAIITYVDLLKQENITEEERVSYIRTIEQKSDRLKCLIEDLFEVSKANSGNICLNLQQVDVVSLLKQIRFEMEEDLEKSDLTFRWNLPEEKVCLLLDGQRTYRIFENLLTNMLKYAMPHTRAYVDLLCMDQKAIVVFRNVSAAELDFDVQRLSERFVRGDTSRNTPGHGLGLAIVKSFVEIQNGTFRIDVDGDLFKVTIAWEIPPAMS